VTEVILHQLSPAQSEASVLLGWTFPARPNARQPGIFMKLQRHMFTRAGILLLAPALLVGCAANMHAAHHQGGEPMHMSAKDMTAMCDMHKEMMSGKTPQQRQEMMARHMKSMSQEMRQHMQMMMQQCK
jgi:hypothetical protein